ncbi:unnamed protein product [Enterobius vermicularis]|uniref:F-box domain-containing protein n=1 Tax=Enterobius vermicularis TaxID=51028 RepID=A0A0N4VQ63_ENTVE|nr:unnamed protein product [Enterobius vermicularis]
MSASDSDDYLPHCFVKTGKSKEFIGCTSMSEAFHRLDLARAVKDVRRINYICKVVQILVQDKLQNLSATARKNLLAIIQAISDLYTSTIRSLVLSFGSGLEGHLFGSPKLILKQMDTVGDLLEFISERRLGTLAESEEDSITFMDLPRELVLMILRLVFDFDFLLLTFLWFAVSPHETLEAIVQRESQLWVTLCLFHFSQEQIERHFKGCNNSWRHVFFELKKYYGLREVYADLIHLCCHCKALFWKNLGHPCVSKDAPSVRVTPKQFVDMLLFL